MVFLFHFLDQKARFSPTMEEEMKQSGERTGENIVMDFIRSTIIKTSFCCMMCGGRILCGNDVVLLGGYFMLLLPCPEIARELWQKLRSNGV